MKKQTLILLISTLLTVPAFAETFKSADDAVKKLEAYTVSDVEGDKARLEARQPLRIDQMFEDLEGAVKLIGKQALTEDLAYQMGRVTIITFINDPSAYAVGEIILPVYQKNKKVFEKAAQKLHPVDRKLLLDTLKSFDEASSEGQG